MYRAVSASGFGYSGACIGKLSDGLCSFVQLEIRVFPTKFRLDTTLVPSTKMMVQAGPPLDYDDLYDPQAIDRYLGI